LQVCHTRTGAGACNTEVQVRAEINILHPEGVRATRISKAQQTCAPCRSMSFDLIEEPVQHPGNTDRHADGSGRHHNTGETASIITPGGCQKGAEGWAEGSSPRFTLSRQLFDSSAPVRRLPALRIRQTAALPYIPFLTGDTVTASLCDVSEVNRESQGPSPVPIPPPAVRRCELAPRPESPSLLRCGIHFRCTSITAGSHQYPG
jgi:hypothetical protein